MNRRDRIEALASRMDVPARRVRDVRWLNRNVAIRNADHEDIDELRVLIRAELSRKVEAPPVPSDALSWRTCGKCNTGFLGTETDHYCEGCGFVVGENL